MVWYINDLSLSGQYSNVPAFIKDLTELMRLRHQLPLLNQKLFCSRGLDTRPVTHSNDFRQAVMSEKALVKPVLQWLTRNGPFWDDDREPNQNDYFEYCGEDVTDQGVGEAARRTLVGAECFVVSFPNEKFKITPLEIAQGLPEELLANVLVENIWSFSQLENSANTILPAPVNWTQMLNQAEIRYDKLIFIPGCIDSLKKEPFSAYVVERVFELFAVLNEFMQCRDDNGNYTARNDELIAQHFSGGDKKWFSNSSITEEHKFKQEMSFPDPEHPEEKVFCPWHGKIKTPQYRVHFEWPSKTTIKLRIFYIGPKITKV
ncbi:MAG: hypothetical protein EPN17_17280 [Methylobacter sp.]|nr:MAG: hypothetical protein EPN17_17280 [Methylobacter sp.]